MVNTPLKLVLQTTKVSKLIFAFSFKFRSLNLLPYLVSNLNFKCELVYIAQTVSVHICIWDN